MTPHEDRRLAALHEYDLLDAPAGDELEAVVRVAAAVAGGTNATLNLIDENRQCQLTSAGFEGSDTPRSASMCAIRFESGEFTYHPDASEAAGYRDNPWVTGELGEVRFYASFPLVTPQGYALGALCVFDGQRRELTAGQIARLTDIALVIVGLFERRRQARVNASLADELAATVEELRRSNTELEQFAGVVSHDLASPLAVVGGYLELIDDRLDGRDEQASAWIGTAHRAVGRMQGLISSLLTYAHAGNTAYRFEPVPLGELVEQAVADLDVRLAGATVDVQPGLPVLQADPTLIRQLLQNLVGNALKYRHPERPCRIAVTADRHGAHWRVAVVDNGPGIPADCRTRVFEMFAQLDPRARTGYGVGLATCRRIVDRHGGQIAVTDTPGGGTTVTFTVPAALPAAVAA